MDKVFLDCEQVLARLRERGVCMGQVVPEVYHRMKGELERALGVPVVSKSTLSDFAAGAYRFRWNELHGGREVSAGMALGSLVDCLTLTPELFDDLYLCEEKKVAVKRDGSPYANGQQDAEQKARWAAATEEGVTVIAPELLGKGQAMAGLALRHLEFVGLPVGAWRSQVAVWVYLKELDGVELACPVVVCGMLDILPLEGPRIVDLKTTSADVADRVKLGYALEDFRYGLQAAMYLDLFNLASGEARDEFAFLFVGAAEPHMSRLVVLGAQMVDLYREEYKGLLRRFCVAWKADDWGEPMLEPVWWCPSAREWKRLQGGV